MTAILKSYLLIYYSITESIHLSTYQRMRTHFLELHSTSNLEQHIQVLNDTGLQPEQTISIIINFVAHATLPHHHVTMPPLL